MTNLTVDKVYDRLSQHFYVWEPNESFEKIFDESFDLACSKLDKKNIEIFEAGAGHGTWLKRLLSRGFSNVHGMDLSAKRVEQARQYLNRSVILHGDILADTYPGKFDLIFACEALQHLSISEIKKLFDRWDLHSNDRAAFFIIDKDSRSLYAKAVELNKKAGASGRRLLRMLQIPTYGEDFSILYDKIHYPDFEALNKLCCQKGYRVHSILKKGRFRSIVFTKGEC